ncbi:MAG: Rossmann-like and DUF2520 domain-containing protein [Polyangia bacterium]
MTTSLFADEAQPERSTQVLVVGAGPVGLCFERALSHVGFPVRSWSRSHGPLWPQGSEPVAADIVILAVRDDAIPHAAEYIVTHGGAGPQSVVLHCAGGRPPSQVLGSIRELVKGIGLLHPLRSFVHTGSSDDREGSGPQKEHELIGTVMALCGDSSGLAAGQELCQALSGVPLVLPEDRLPMYHAAAVLAAGHVATLLDVAVQLLSRIGLDRKAAATALTALTESVLLNIRQVGLPQALTGPIARGDALTVASHLDALNRQSCQVGDIYRVLAESSLDIAYRKGAAEDSALAAVGDVLAARRV